MRLSPDEILDLLANHYPRYLRDAGVSAFTTDRVPDARILLIFDQVLLDGHPMYGDPIVTAHAVSLKVARELHNQLGAIIDEVDDEL